jgi:hypothetical protein
VGKRGNKYRAQICYKGKYISLGVYGTPEEAAAAYRQKARELFGDFYRDTDRGKL